MKKPMIKKLNKNGMKAKNNKLSKNRNNKNNINK